MQLHAESVPSITGQPQSKEVLEGDSVEFKVAAKNDLIGKKQDNFDIPLSGNVKLKMIRIKPGTFTMGSPKGESSGRRDDEVQHQVTLTKDYWLGKYEVTQAQYQAVMGSNPSHFKGHNLPVEQVEWNNAMSFCARLTEMERKAGRLPEGYEYTLPTEAQWEYACRAGTTTALNNGKSPEFFNVDEVGWFQKNSNETHPVGQKKPNAWGLYDMHGNVNEWCLDWFGAYPTSSVTDPAGPGTGSYHVLRGGGWTSTPSGCRSAYRRNDAPPEAIRSQVLTGQERSISNLRTVYKNVPRSDILKQFGFRVALSMVSSQKGRSISGSGSTKNLTYQWYKDGKTINGATNPNYRINNVKPSDAGRYTVKVCNQAGCVTSKEAVLKIKEKIRIVEQPQSQTVKEGSTVTFRVTVTGTDPQYQWYKGGRSIRNATDSSYTTKHVKPSNAGKYKVKVFNAMGNVFSKEAVLKVNKKIRITEQPKSQTVKEGDAVTFRVTVIGTDPQYQWYKDGEAIEGAIGSEYIIEEVIPEDDGTYSVSISNELGDDVISEMATLTIDVDSQNMNSSEDEKSEDPLVIISQPEDNSEEDLPEDSPKEERPKGKQPKKDLPKEEPSEEEPPEDQSLKEGNSGAIIVKREGKPDIVIDMIWIKVKPTFLMGSPENELGRSDNETQHPVILTKNYWLGKYEVTQAQYEAVMGTNPSGFKGSADLPVEQVSWDDAMEFCVKLTETAGKVKVLPKGYKFMLPTEAQWEYACRADTITALNNGKDLTDEFECPELDEAAWYWSNSADSTHIAGQKKPNAWGLYDMHGNVWEWCLDGFTVFGRETVTDPYHKEDPCRVVRGGGWHGDAYSCRSASRDKSEPGVRDDIYGFRLALVPVQ